MTETLTIDRPDDWHLHLRDGDRLAQTVPATARIFARAIVTVDVKAGKVQASPETLRATMATLIEKGMPDKGMPGLAGQVSAEEIDDIVAHVLALRGE